MTQSQQCHPVCSDEQSNLVTKTVGMLRTDWHLLTNPAVPIHAKVLPALVGLAYLILPVDVMPDPLLGPGQVDDLGVLALMVIAFHLLARASVVAATMAGPPPPYSRENGGSGQLVGPNEPVPGSSPAAVTFTDVGPAGSPSRGAWGVHRPELPNINIYNRYPGGGYCGLAALLVVILIAGFVVWRIALGGNPLAPPITPTPTRDLRTIVQRLRDIKKLETVHYFTEKVTVQEARACVFGGETLVLLFYGQGVVGIDLEDLTEGSIEVNEERTQAILRLPRPRLLHAFLDVGETKVAFHYVPPLCPSLALEMALTAEVRAREEVQRVGDDERYLKTSETNAKSFFEFLLKEFGFQEVEVIFETPEAESETMALPTVEIMGTLPPLLTSEPTEVPASPPAATDVPTPSPVATPAAAETVAP